MDSSMSCAIGWSIHEKMDKLLHVVNEEIEEQYIWVEEVLAEAQKTMSRTEISLLPKTPTEKQKRNMRRCCAMESSHGETQMTYSEMQKTHYDSDSQLFESSDFSIGDRVTLHQSPNVADVHKPIRGHFHERVTDASNNRSHLSSLVSGNTGKRDCRSTAAAELMEPRDDYERQKYVLGLLRNTGKEMSAEEHQHRSHFLSSTCRSKSSLNFLEPFPRNWCDISFEEGQNSTLAMNAWMPHKQGPVFSVKCISPVKPSMISTTNSFGSNLVSTGVQTDCGQYDEPSCNCQRKIMVNRDVQTEDTFVIQVCGSTQSTSAGPSISLLDQQGSPAVTDLQRLSKYFPTVADELVERAESNCGKECLELSESHCLEGGCGEDVAIASELSDMNSFTSWEDGKPILRWETSVDLNNVSDSKFGAVAYESNGVSDDTSARSVESEEKNLCSLRNRSDQSGMSLAIEMSKARMLTGLQTLISTELSNKVVIREDSSESFPSPKQDYSSATKDSCQSDYADLLKALADSGPLPSKQTKECGKLPVKTGPVLAIGRQSQVLPTMSISGVRAVPSQAKVNTKVSRIPPPPPRRPPVGNATAVTLNNKACNLDKLSFGQKSFDFTKCPAKFAKEERPPSVGITYSTQLPSSLAIDGTSSPVKQQRECSKLPVDTRNSCNISTPASNRRKQLAVGTPMQSARNNICGVEAIRSQATGELQSNKKTVDRMSTTGRASQITSGVRTSGTRRQSRGTEHCSRPSVTPRSSRVKGGPRLSVGRKSLSKRRSMGLQEKHRSTKLTRPVAWLLNATKSTKRKAKGSKLSGNAMVESTDGNSRTSSAHVQQTETALRPGNIVSSGSIRSKIQKFQNVFSQKPTEAKMVRCEMLPPSTPVVPRCNIKKSNSGNVPASPLRTTSTSQVLRVTATPSKSHQSTTSLANCFSPGRESSLEQVPPPTNVPINEQSATSVTRPVAGASTANDLGSRQTPKRGLFHRIQDRMKAKQAAADAKASAIKHSVSECSKVLHLPSQKTMPANQQDKCSRPEDQARDSPVKKNLPHSNSKSSVHSGTSQQSAVSAGGSTKPALNRVYLSRLMSQTTSINSPPVESQVDTSVGINTHSPQSTVVTAADVHCNVNQTLDVEEEEEEEEYNNYDITQICSDDSTDDESNPKMPPPIWAQEKQLMSTLIYFHYHPVDAVDIFGHIRPPDLNVMFDVKKPRFNKRTSSANWDLPLSCSYELASAFY